MQVPPIISFKDVPKTPELEALILDKIAKLEKICSYMISCRVMVEQPQTHQRRGNQYRVRISMTVPPGHELIAEEPSSQGDMHDPVHVVITKVFHIAEGRLKELMEKQRGDIKSHPEQEVMGIVHALFPDEGYGFIRSVDTQEDIYFHRNSVLHGDFERLKLGTGVRYVAEPGDKGLQATTVEIVYHKWPIGTA